MSPSTFEEYDGYASQVAAVVEGGSGHEAEYEGTYAIGFVVLEGAVDPDEVRARLVDAVSPGDRVVDDRRREFDWGASGPATFEFFMGVAATLTGSAILSATRLLLTHVRRERGTPLPARNADTASEAFDSFVRVAFRCRNVRITEVGQRAGGFWHLSAESSRGVVLGIVDPGGEVIVAEISSGEDDPLVWPTESE